MPVFEDGVGDVDTHDSVEKKKNQNGKVEPDELVQLPVEEARPENVNCHSIACESYLYEVICYYHFDKNIHQGITYVQIWV